MLVKSQLNIIFIIVTVFSASLLLYLGINIAERIHDTKGALRLLSAGLLPVPAALFTGYLLKPVKEKKVISKDKSIKSAVLWFFVSFTVIMLFVYFYETIFDLVFKDQLLPFILNSGIIIFYTLNYMTNNNLKLAGILSGLLFGTALYIFIF